MTNTEVWLKETISHLESIENIYAWFTTMASLPNCHDCKRKDCEYKPKWGDHIRYNCPLHSAEQTEPKCETCKWDDKDNGCPWASMGRCEYEPKGEE